MVEYQIVALTFVGSNPIISPLICVINKIQFLFIIFTVFQICLRAINFDIYEY